MKSLALPFSLLVAVSLYGSTASAEERPGRGSTHPLAWDALEKSAEAKPGENATGFSFKVTNQSSAAVVIKGAHTSCGCTVAELPATPWTLAAGASGDIKVVVDHGGKEGRVTKTVEIDSSAGLQTLLVTVNVPPPDETQRECNRQIAAANRQAVFRGECASCHAAPIGTKTGGELLLAACAICHVSAHRASIVPDLMTAREHRDAAFWRKWIGEGKEQTLMPAFARERGGPLTNEQIESLVEFCVRNLPTEPRKTE
jgi:mono/diheme cytochrome c family protein